MADVYQQNFNKFTYLPTIPYKITSYLIANNDIIWRLLQYNDADAWKSDNQHPNLTKVQKGALIYDGIRKEVDCRVFLDQGQDDSFQEQACLLRISVLEAIPTNYIWGHISIGFEIFSHYKINILSNYQPRANMIAQQLIETLNGADIGEGVGRIYFDASKYSKSTMRIIGEEPYKGIAVLMCIHAL